MPRHIPMLFKAEMIRAMLDGRKTETRRIIEPETFFPPSKGAEAANCVHISREEGGRLRGYGPFKVKAKPGDLIWCKETWRPLDGYGAWDLLIRYNEDGSQRHIQDGDVDFGDWSRPKAAATGNVSPLFMPKWASRLTLPVTGYRIERLHDIDEAGAVSEGVEWLHAGYHDDDDVYRNYMGGRDFGGSGAARSSYATLWNHINGPGSWEANPWVDVTSYEVIKRNILDVAA